MICVARVESIVSVFFLLNDTLKLSIKNEYFILNFIQLKQL